MRVGFIILLLCSFTIPARANLRVEIRKPFSLFLNGHHKRSIQNLRMLRARYKNEPMIHYLIGRNYFALGDMKRAALFFRRSGLKYADSNGAFEIGMSFYHMQAFQSSIKAFKKVRSSALRSYALFYAGLAAYRLKAFNEAERYLQATNQLPASMQRQKNQVLQDIRNQNALAYSQRRAKEPIFYQPPAQSRPPPMTQSYAKQVDPFQIAEEEKAAPQVPKSFLTLSFTPGMTYKSSTSSSTLHGTGESKVVSAGPSTKMSVAAKLDPNYQSDDEGMIFTLAGDAQVSNISNTTKDLVFVASEDSIEEQESSVISAAQSTNFSVSPKLNLPLWELLSVEAFGKYQEIWPDNDSTLAEQILSGGGSTNLKLDKIQTSLSFLLMEKSRPDINFSDSGGIASTSDQKIDLDGSYSFSDGYEAKLGFSQYFTSLPVYFSIAGFQVQQTIGGHIKKSFESTTFTTGVDQSQSSPANLVDVETGEPLTLAGTYESLNFYGAATLNLALGASINGKFSYFNNGKIVAKGLCPQDDEGFVEDCGENTQDTQASSTGYRLSIDTSFSPLGWLSLSANLSTLSQEFAVQNADVKKDFISRNIDGQTAIGFSISLSKTF